MSRTPTRFIRWAHGSNSRYSRLVSRSLAMWREIEREADREIFSSTGVAWIVRLDDPWLESSIEALGSMNVPFRLTPANGAADVIPGISLAPDEGLLVETEAGLLHAEVAIEVVESKARRLGVRFVQGHAVPTGGAAEVGSQTFEADALIWSVGPWLGRLFGDLLSVEATRQNVFYMSAPESWADRPVPAWIDLGRGLYGTDDMDGSGMKIAVDAVGPAVDDIDADDQVPEADVERRCLNAFRQRFPSLSIGPIRRRERCYYGLTPDGEWILARHPEHSRVWLVGGDSGHGFKHGPQVGELIAECVESDRAPDEAWGLAPRSPRNSGVRTTASRRA